MTGRCLFGFSGEKPFLLPDNEGVKMNTSPVRMDDLPLNRFHCRIAALTFGAHLTDGYVLGVIGYAIIQLTPAMQLTPFMAGMIGGSALLGLFLGSLVLGWISDHIGRQQGKAFVSDASFKRRGQVKLREEFRECMGI